MDSLIIIDHARSLKEKQQSLIKIGSPLPAIGRSMTGGGEGPSAAEVVTSFPARLLGAIEELWKFSNFLNGEERGRKKGQSSLKISSKEICSFSAPRAFIGQWAPKTMPRKGHRPPFRINLKCCLKRLPEKHWFSHEGLTSPWVKMRTLHNPSRTSPKGLP